MKAWPGSVTPRSATSALLGDPPRPWHADRVQALKDDLKTS